MEAQRIIAGIDEAGRGPLAGPVSAAAVLLPSDYHHDEIADSKALSESRREKLFDEIIAHAIAHAIIFVGPREIEQINIREATRAAMQQAADQVLAQLQNQNFVGTCHFMVDGNMPLAENYSSQAVIKGDSTVFCISAASILAKVSRDRLMKELDAQYPGYGLAGHKGYPTKAHREKIRQLGPCEIHRRTFAGVREFL